MNLTDIHFPVFRLLNKRPIKVGEVDSYSNIYFNKDTGDEYTITSIVDDKSIPGDTLAKRRMKLVDQGVNLFSLKYAFFSIHDFLKEAKASRWFIDSSGTIFTYKKTKVVPLRFLPVKNIISSPATGSLIEVHGFTTRFKTLKYIDSPLNKWAGFLYLDNKTPLFYGVVTEKYQDTRRKI